VHGVIGRGWTINVLLRWVDGRCMVLPVWVNSTWCYRRGWTVHGVIGVGEQCMLLSAWVDSAWYYRRGWTVSGTCIMISVSIDRL
jgi:hypothetical protein